MKHCQYCAQTDTRLDEFGYCKKHDCFGQSGKRDKYNSLVDRANSIYSVPDKHIQLGRVVTNRYSLRTRTANAIVRDAELEFGFVPMSLYEKIPTEYRKQWDAHIRW